MSKVFVAGFWLLVFICALRLLAYDASGWARVVGGLLLTYVVLIGVVAIAEECGL